MKKVYTNYRMPTRNVLSKMPITEIIRHKLRHQPDIANNVNELCVFIWRIQGAKKLMHISDPDKASVSTIMRTLANVKREMEDEL